MLVCLGNGRFVVVPDGLVEEAFQFILGEGVFAVLGVVGDQSCPDEIVVRRLVVLAGELLGARHPHFDRVEFVGVIVVVGFQAQRYGLHAAVLFFARETEHGVGLEQHFRVLFVAVAPAVVGYERAVETVGRGLGGNRRYRCRQYHQK